MCSCHACPGHGKLRHKVGALLHQLRLEVGSSAQAVACYCRSVIGLCSDHGVESGIADVPSLSFVDILESEARAAGFTDVRAISDIILPRSLGGVSAGVLQDEPSTLSMALSGGVAVMDSNLSGVEPIAASTASAAHANIELPSSDLAKLFPNAIFIPGVKHSMDNCCKDIWQAMSHKQEFLNQLRTLECLLKPVGIRDKLIALFFQGDTDLEVQTASHLRSWKSSLASLRWHEVVNFTREVLRIRDGLRTHWDLQKFIKSMPSTGRVVEGRGHQGTKTYKETNVIVKSDFFWQYAELILEISKAADCLSRWAEGCWYHASNCDSSWCPYKGCRGGELAAGCHKHLLTETQSYTTAMVVAITNSSSVPMSSAKKKLLIGDWHAANARLQLEFDIKLHYWDELPWKLLGLSVSQLSIARCIGRTCQNMWARLTPLQQKTSHPMTRRFLDPSWRGTLHNHVRRLVCLGSMNLSRKSRCHLQYFVVGVQYMEGRASMAPNVQGG